jgi:hypothetical protein
VDRIDWECEVKTLFRDENAGCGRAVSEAITWFFREEEEGIILEDDCLPDPSFFPFCREMLFRFRDVPEVASVSGDNFFPPALHSSQPYHFSKYAQIWGWATWRRFWNGYDFRLKGELSEWEQILKALRSGLIDTWDYQVMFSAWRLELVHIYPSKNLIANLGYGVEATHTRFDSPLSQHESTHIDGFEITLPITVDPKLDDTTFYFRFLESLTSIWWLEAAIDPTQHVGWARWQCTQAQTELARLKQLTDKQAETIAVVLEARSREIFRAQIRLLVAHFVFTFRRAVELARGRLNEILKRSRSTSSTPEVTSGKDYPAVKDKSAVPQEKSVTH